MIELIKIEKLTRNNEETLTVNARELWEVLEVNDKFADWINRQLERGKFVEERDFIVIREKAKNPQGGRPATEYHLTIDTAKHIGMMSNTAQGIKVREYFIECEKMLKENLQPQYKLPKTFSEALHMLADSVELVETQKKALELAAPKVAFADAVNDSSNSMDLGVFAKILGTGRTRLFEWLREQGYLMATGTKPFQKYLENGYFVVIETTFARGDTTQTYGKTQICGKGQLAIEKKWAESRKEVGE